MCFCYEEKDNECSLCYKSFSYHKYLTCNKCERTYHYKCAYKISKHLDKCLYCGFVKFILTYDKRDYYNIN